MRKAVIKRIKLTRHGKILRRRAGQNHFNAKAARRIQQRRKTFASFPKTLEKKIIKSYL